MGNADIPITIALYVALVAFSLLYMVAPPGQLASFSPFVAVTEAPLTPDASSTLRQAEGVELETWERDHGGDIPEDSDILTGDDEESSSGRRRRSIANTRDRPRTGLPASRSGAVSSSSSVESPINTHQLQRAAHEYGRRGRHRRVESSDESSSSEASDESEGTMQELVGRARQREQAKGPGRREWR